MIVHYFPRRRDDRVPSYETAAAALIFLLDVRPALITTREYHEDDPLPRSAIFGEISKTRERRNRSDRS